MIRALSLLLLVLSSTLSSVSALRWIFDSKKATCEGNPFAENVYITGSCTKENACGGGYSTCSHEAKCSPGDIADIKGRLTATTAFSNAQILVKPCFKMYCSNSDARIDGRICDWITPVSADTTCGAPVDYIFDYRVRLPAGATMYQWVLDTLTIKIHIDEATECKTNSVNSYRLPYNLMGLGVLAGIAFALWRDDKMKRRLRNEEEKEKKEYNDEETQNDEESYVEMGTMGSNCSGDSVPTTSYNPPVSVVNVNVQSRNNPQNSSEPDNKIPLEVLREFYKKKGIAIV